MQAQDTHGMTIRLSDQQLELMRVIWSRGPSTVSEVQEGLESELAYTTVATVLGRLEKAGALRREPGEGRSYVYAAEVSEEAVQRSMTRSFIERVFGGNPRALLNHLVDEDAIDPDDLAALEARLEAEEAQRAKETDDV